MALRRLDSAWWPQSRAGSAWCWCRLRADPLGRSRRPSWPRPTIHSGRWPCFCRRKARRCRPCTSLSCLAQNPRRSSARWPVKRGRRTLSAVAMPNSDQWWMHKTTNWRMVFIARLHVRLTSVLSQETQYLASILTDNVVESICHNTNCAHEKYSLHARCLAFESIAIFLINRRTLDVSPRPQRPIWENWKPFQYLVVGILLLAILQRFERQINLLQYIRKPLVFGGSAETSCGTACSWKDNKKELKINDENRKRARWPRLKHTELWS